MPQDRDDAEGLSIADAASKSSWNVTSSQEVETNSNTNKRQ